MWYTCMLHLKNTGEVLYSRVGDWHFDKRWVHYHSIRIVPSSFQATEMKIGLKNTKGFIEELYNLWPFISPCGHPSTGNFRPSLSSATWPSPLTLYISPSVGPWLKPSMKPRIPFLAGTSITNRGRNWSPLTVGIRPRGCGLLYHRSYDSARYKWYIKRYT